jgi:cell division protein FtsW (lipid II flippase)
MHPKTKDIAEKSVLLVPLLIAFLWMGFVVLDTQSAEPGVKMAPSRLNSLINVLFVFIVGYAAILSVMFYRMNKKLKEMVHKKFEEDHPLPKKKGKKK